MATTYKTPGVYINEVSTLPASVAQVETAIPAFIGYTEMATDSDGSSLTDVPKRITSLVEYRQYFGGAADPIGTFGSGTSTKPTVILDAANGYAVSSLKLTDKYHMFNSMQAYFANGGGPCYIVSVGDYNYTRANATVKTDLEGGIGAVEPEDEVTLIVAPDATVLSASNLGAVQQKILMQCNKLQDRFGVFDLKENASSSDVGEGDFRTNIGTQYLKYGAAYGPWLETTFVYDLQFSDLQIEEKAAPGVADVSMLDATAVGNITQAVSDLAAIQAVIDLDYLDQYDGEASTGKPDLQTKTGYLHTLTSTMRSFLDTLGDDDIITSVAGKVKKNTDLSAIIRQARAYDEAYPSSPPLGVFLDNDFDGTDITTFPTGLAAVDFDYDLTTDITADGTVYGPAGTAAERVASATPFFRALLVDALAILDDIKSEAQRVIRLLETALVSSDSIYAGVKQAIAAQGIILPPSGVMVGVYASTDATRGVWKAPANISVSNVVRPTIKVDNQTQESLNIDSTGKSVNIIRSFTGKGVLVWGARTLAGNDNEWRYVPVRRLFITAEEAIKKATEFVVFEPNDANTWLRTRTMIENYLTGLWRQGALAGAKPSEAFFVNVGLGETMTAQDILEGKMIVEIGMAAVRPAEFIILRFSHKLQES
jgi:hypothetical protein